MGLLKDKLDKFSLALKNLEEALSDPIKTNRDRAGIIQTFEFTYEMSWRLLRELLAQQGFEAPSSPRSVFKDAYSAKLINNEEAWLSMILQRNLTTHTYDQNTADEVIKLISSSYLPNLKSLYETAQQHS
ncbi:MAG: HI0074 family nucleotidyltransferase substrate-binding subunit [Bdellovibrionales bacterium]